MEFRYEQRYGTYLRDSSNYQMGDSSNSTYLPDNPSQPGIILHHVQPQPPTLLELPESLHLPPALPVQDPHPQISLHYCGPLPVHFFQAPLRPIIPPSGKIPCFRVWIARSDEGYEQVKHQLREGEVGVVSVQASATSIPNQHKPPYKRGPLKTALAIPSTRKEPPENEKDKKKNTPNR